MLSIPTLRSASRHRLAYLAYATALLPIITINFAYVLAALGGSVPECVPYLQGCTSISSTGRVNPSQWIFKPLMLASALLTGWFFLASAAKTGRQAHGADALGLSGIVGAAALVLYVIFLGSEGESYRLLRRYGVSLYFGFTYLAQLLLARRLRRSSPQKLAPQAMLAISALLLFVGIGSIPITHLLTDKGQLENAIEWNFALLMQLNFLLAGWALRPEKPVEIRLSDQQGFSDDRRSILPKP